MSGPPCVVRSRVAFLRPPGALSCLRGYYTPNVFGCQQANTNLFGFFLHWKFDFYSVLYAHIFTILSMRSKHRLRPCAGNTNLPIKRGVFVTF